MLELFNLQGRVAVVTGARRGMGQAMALALAEAGADIVAVDLEASSHTEEEVRSRGRRCVGVVADVSDLSPARAAELLEQGAEQLGRLDILINNAAVNRRVFALDLTTDDWEAVRRVDLDAVFFLSQAAAAHFRKQEKPGKIINMASMLSFQGGYGTSAYAAAKSGVLGLTRALANEWARFEINVNAIAPGWIMTEFTQALRANPERYQHISGRIPAGRWGEPDDVRGAAVFLASDASRYVHGAVIPVDGGWLAW